MSDAPTPSPEDGWAPFSPVDRAMARRMQRAAEIALATQFTEVDMAPVLAEVERQRGDGVPATVTSVLLGVVAKALVEHPQIASEVDYEHWVKRVPESPGVGVAVATDRGLVVPVVARVTELTHAEIAAELDRLVRAVRAGDPSPDLFRGGHFSITNMGVLPITGGVPIPMLPQPAILGVGGTWEAPVVVDGEIAITKLARFTVGQDHRALDGITVGNFLVAVKRHAESVDGLRLPARG